MNALYKKRLNLLFRNTAFSIDFNSDVDWMVSRIKFLGDDFWTLLFEINNDLKDTCKKEWIIRGGNIYKI